MEKQSKNVAALLAELNQERYVRIANLNHAIQLIRVTCITSKAISSKIEDIEICKDMGALHNILITMLDAMEGEVVNEISKLNLTNKGDKKIIH